jgi:glycosyltransferase involved in cell wall biosynthesis
MQFSILIPTWNNLPLLKLCLRSIQSHSRFEHQIIVHVNDGSDGTLQWVREQGISHTYSPQNIGICLAMNRSADLAESDYLVYLNDDMYCCPEWDARLAARLDEMGNQSFMLSGTLIEPIASGNACVVVAHFGTGPDDFDEAGLLAAAPSLTRADWLGATWPPFVMRKQDWLDIGGFSSEFSPGMSSDNDLSMKLWNIGCRIFIGAGDALIYHFMSKSTGKVRRNNGRRTFLNKWGMSHSMFDRHYLRRGEARSSQELILQEPPKTLGFYLDQIRCSIKRRLS